MSHSTQRTGNEESNSCLSDKDKVNTQGHVVLTLPKLPLPSTIRKLKSDSLMRSWLPLESNREAAFADFPSVFLPTAILAL